MTLHVQKTSVRRKLLIIVLLFAALASLAYGGYALWQKQYVAHEPRETITDKVITYSTDKPSEIKPTEACNEYTTEDALPERISISSIGVNGCIVQVGIDQYNAIALPDTIYTAGWYIRSSPPGKPGLSIINGYMSGRHKIDAIFQHLDELKSGDSFTVTLGSGKALRYEIYKTQSVSLNKVAQVVIEKDPNIGSQLNLVTCSGEYGKSTTSYDQRIIVSAALR